MQLSDSPLHIPSICLETHLIRRLSCLPLAASPPSSAPQANKVSPHCPFPFPSSYNRSLHINTSPGGSVITALLADGIFTPRAVTRSASSPAAQALLDRGCEVVEANLGDQEAVTRAVEGAECVFGVSGEAVLVRDS